METIVEEKYDSGPDTLKHIKQVQEGLQEFCKGLYHRGLNHDLSKLTSPVEKEGFDLLTPRLRNLVYNSPEYKVSLEELKPALEHHYANNSHHPEFYKEKGISGMNLLDLVEMWYDWKAAVKRTEGGDIFKSLEINRKRFNISDQLYDILKNSI